ncbi:hypothetical protein VULLAG_LOCUS278 [Vulpes lagopus]
MWAESWDESRKQGLLSLGSSEVEKLWIAAHLIEVITKKLSSRRHMTQFSSLEWEEEAIGTRDSWDSDNE